METRERRRWLTDRSAHHKQRVARACSGHWDVQGFTYTARPDEELLQGPLLGKMRKGKSIGCGCRHRTHGNPKCGSGICVTVDYRPAVVARIHGKRLCRSWMGDLRGGVFPDDLEG